VPPDMPLSTSGRFIVDARGIRALTDEGLIVIPNCHLLTYGWCCSDTDGNGLWFNETWPAGTFVSTWQDIASRYAGDGREPVVGPGLGHRHRLNTSCPGRLRLMS
jgi:hypothetical protein